MAVAKDSLEGREELDVKGIGVDLLFDGLHLDAVELFDQDDYRVRDPIE